MHQGTTSLEPAQDIHLQSCSVRQLPCTPMSLRRLNRWRRSLRDERKDGLRSVTLWQPLPSFKARGRCRGVPQAGGRIDASERGLSASSHAASASVGDGQRTVLDQSASEEEWPRRSGSFMASSSGASDDMQFNNLQGSSPYRGGPVGPGEVYETPRRGPGFTDVPQPVRRVRQQRTDAPANSRPPNRESWYPRKPQPLFEQIEVHVTMTPDDEERAVREKGYWVQMLQKAGLLDSGAALPTVRKELNTKSRSGPFRSGYLVNRLLSQISDWRTVFTVLRDLEPLFDHINISTAMHRLAKVSYKNKVPLNVVQAHPMYPHLLTVLKKKVLSGKMRARQLANTLWAFGKLGHDAEDVVDALLFQMHRTHIATWQEQEMSNAVWAMATLSRPDEGLLETMARDAMRRGMSAFVPQAISNLVWGFAVLEYNNNPFMLAVAEYFVMDLSHFATQAVSNILWGCAVLNFYDQDMFNAAALEIQHRIGSFNDQEISNSLLAFAKMEHVDVSLLRVFEEDIRRPQRVRDFTSQALSNMVWSFATLRWYPEKVLEAISAELLRRMPYLSVQEISVSIWAMAKLGYHPGRSLAEFGRRIEELVPDFNSQACANTLWGLSVLQATQLPCFQMLIDRLGSNNIDKVEVLMLHQLFQSLMLARLEARRQNLADPIRTIPDHIYALLRRVWKATVKNTLSSRFHIDVSKMLRELGVAHDFEFVTEDGLFSLDIALAGPRGPVAIEVDGPYHFTLNTRQPLGSTLIRRRLLHALGWTVLSVPFYDYYRLGSTAAKMQYLGQLLRKVDIVVEVDELLRERESAEAEAAAGAESLGSLELPQGRPSPSDGPTRQDDIAGPNFPAQPTTWSSKSRYQERAPMAPRQGQGASTAPHSVNSDELSLPPPRPGPASVRSQAPVARNPLSRPQPRAGFAASQRQPSLATSGRPLNGAVAAAESRASGESEQTGPESSQETEAERGRDGEGTSALHETALRAAVTQWSASVEQNGARVRSGEEQSVERDWKAERAAQLEGQLLKTELQPLCRKYGLPTTGRKEKIVQRLLSYEAVHRPS